MPHAVINTPLGALTLFEEDGALIAVEWGRAPDETSTPLLDIARDELDGYFDGRILRWSVPLRPAGSPFQVRAWQRLMQIPYGTTQSYGTLARDLATSPRAIARACASNPIPIFIPCHRVVAAGGRLGGYSGGEGVDTERALLRLEQAPLADLEAAEYERQAASTVVTGRET